MIRSVSLGAVLVVWAGSAVLALDIPKEVTPEIRAACERDVRRLCIRSDSTIDTVKACVRANFSSLNVACRMRLAVAGFGG